MREMYWSPRKLPRKLVSAIGLCAVLAIAIVELFPRVVEQPAYREKLAASKRALSAMQDLKAERLRRGHPIEPEFDPAETGLIGTLLTPVTSISGHLQSKQTSINPNFAAIVVDMLVKAGVQPGDRIAVGYSGSFPAVNVCVCCAIEELQLRPIAVASAAASQFGANFPDFMWIDMERCLAERGHISFRSIASSRGGYEDRGLGLTAEARDLVTQAIARNGLPLIEADSFEAAVDERMELYARQAGGEPIKAYINVGGGTVSVGRSLGKRMYEPGLNLEPPAGSLAIDSVMTRFMQAGTPVLHLVEITQLAERYGLPSPPAEMPPIGQSTVYVNRDYNRVLSGGLLAALVVLLAAMTRPRRPIADRQALPDRRPHVVVERPTRIAESTTAWNTSNDDARMSKEIRMSQVES